MDDFNFLFNQMKNSIQPSTGCTEPVAIALNCATARKHAPGDIQRVIISVDIGLLKNAMYVGIPGVSGHGIQLSAALGIVGGDPDDGMNVLSNIQKSHEELAQDILPFISLSIKDDVSDLFIETIIITDITTVRVITYKKHDKILLIENPPFSTFIPADNSEGEKIKMFTLEDMKRFADEIDIKKIAFLQEGIDMNRQIAESGLKMGFGETLAKLNNSSLYGNSLVPYIQMTTGAASFARMTGVQMPVMTVTGSGNQGITLFLTVAAAAEKFGTSKEKLLRGIVMALCVNLLSKAYLGTLSPICACGVSSGVGASVAIVYILDGTIDQMAGTIHSMCGGITGMLCDGAKEGCANKVALSASYAAMSAMTAVLDFSISDMDGILEPDIHQVFENMGYLVKVGMKETNKAIVNLMSKSRQKRKE